MMGILERPARSRLWGLLPVAAGVVLLLWGLMVVVTAFAYGSMPIAGWQTENKRLCGLAWLAVFVVVLLPAYLYAIEMGLRLWRSDTAAAAPNRHTLAALGVTVLLVTLTLCARVAVTAWFPGPLHPPFQELTGGVLPGLIASLLLLILEAGVLAGITHQTRRDQKPYPLLIPAGFALLLLVWALWVVWTGFTSGSFPVVGWQTEYQKQFGTLWLMTTLIVLLPAYVYAISLGLISLLRHHFPRETSQQNFWLVAIANAALLCLITLAARVAVTAWFPGPLHPPLDRLTGGPLMGLSASLVLGLLMVFYYRVARTF